MMKIPPSIDTIGLQHFLSSKTATHALTPSRPPGSLFTPIPLKSQLHAHAGLTGYTRSTSDSHLRESAPPRKFITRIKVRTPRDGDRNYRSARLARVVQL